MILTDFNKKVCLQVKKNSDQRQTTKYIQLKYPNIVEQNSNTATAIM